MTALMRVLLVATLLGLSARTALSDDGADASSVIDPDKGIVFGFPFDTTEDDVTKKLGEPTGRIHLDTHRDGLLYGKSQLLLFYDGKLEGVRISQNILDWEIANLIQEEPREWQLSNGIKLGMNRKDIMAIVKPDAGTEKYNLNYSTSQATVQITFSHRMDIGDGDEAYTVFGLLVSRHGQGVDHWAQASPTSFFRPTNRKMLGLMISNNPAGVNVTGVLPNSPAAKAGIVTGDIITKLDGASMAGVSPIDFNREAGLKDTHSLEVTSKDGTARTVQVAMADGSSFGRDAAHVFDPTAIKVGQMAPDFEVATAPDAAKIKLSDLRGTPVLVIFTATWCTPCKIEAPANKSLYDEYKDRVKFVSVYLDDDKQDIYKYAHGLGADWPINTDGKGWENVAARAYGILGVPTHVLIGKDGKILQTNVRDNAIAPALDDALK